MKSLYTSQDFRKSEHEQDRQTNTYTHTQTDETEPITAEVFACGEFYRFAGHCRLDDWTSCADVQWLKGTRDEAAKTITE